MHWRWHKKVEKSAKVAKILLLRHISSTLKNPCLVHYLHVKKNWLKVDVVDKPQFKVASCFLMNNPVKSLRNAHIFVTNNTREYPPPLKIIWEGVRGIFLVCTEEGACFGNFYYVNLRKLYFHKGGGGWGSGPTPSRSHERDALHIHVCWQSI